MGAPLASGTVLHGRYTITMLLQAGRDGALYQGSDALAAAKLVVIREAADPSPEARARFEQEAHLLMDLEDPSLPVVLDYFTEPSGYQYLVLLGFEEPSLAKALAGAQSFAEPDVLAWFARLTAAIQHLHAQEPPIIHGRISPAHIVITADGTPHLTGLMGLKGGEDADKTPAGRAFLAPEQGEGEPDERTDVYGLGATLYALLTGRAPLDASARAAGKEIAPPRRLAKGISPHVEAAILRAVALDPAQRQADVAELWQALTEPGRPAAAGAAGNWRHLRPPKQRQRRAPRVLLAGAGGALALLAAAALAWHLLPPGQAAAVLPSPTAVRVEATSTVAQVASAPTATVVVPTAMPTAVPPTSTPVPATAAPTATVPVAPSPTPWPAATRWFAGPTASATPRWFPAPVLTSPGDDAIITGVVEFRWSWPYQLADDEYFDLQVYSYSTEPRGIAWCKEPYYVTRDLLRGKGRYEWRVRVIRGHDGQVEGVVSDPSPARILDWEPTGQ